MQPRAIVVGAGIAGFAAAKALDDRGYEVRLLERGASLRAEGAGLTLWPNAVRALRELGLEHVLEGHAHPVTAGATLRPDGEIVARAPLHRIAARFGPLLSVHRGELLEALQRACPVAVELGTEVAYEDGRLLAAAKPLDADLVVGADGIRSVVRELVAPGASIRPAGYGALRGVASIGGLTPEGASETFGPGRRFGMVPLSGERTYWFAVLADGMAEADLEGAFAGWHEPIPTLLGQDGGEQTAFLPLEDLCPLPAWQRGAAVLVGDAAHAMTPNLGQGAAQALLDVAALRRALVDLPIDEAPAAYERARKREAERIVRRSRSLGRIAQLSNPVAARARDVAARITPTSVVAREMERVLR